MPEYLAPGVYVEETSFRQKTIEGVSTSTTGFIGATRFGPIRGEPALLTSFNDFERIYGGIDRLDFEDADGESHNYLAHAVRAYFEEGGRRLYVARTYSDLRDDPGDAPQQDGAGNWSDGVARYSLELSPGEGLDLRARYPGQAGNFQVQFLFRVGENVLGEEPIDSSDPLGGTYRVIRGAANYSVVLVQQGSPLANPQLYWVERFFDEDIQRDSHRLWPASEDTNDNPANAIRLDQFPAAPPGSFLEANADVRVVTVSVIVGALGRFSDEQAWENLHLDPRRRDSLGVTFAAEPTRRFTELFVPLVVDGALENGAAIAELLSSQGSLLDDATPVAESLDDPGASDAARSFRVVLAGGNDGNLPAPGEFEGDDGGADGLKSGLRALEDVEEISILAAPGTTRRYALTDAARDVTAESSAVTRLLISHAERMRYRIAVLDSVDGHTPGEARNWRSSLDSTRAAFYYPWVRIFDPLTEREILQPPSGFVSGIYARNDIERGVHKSPANEVVRLAQGFEFLINRAQQDVLNPEGINCMRFFEGRGFRVWGARTATSDPEWKYVNVRRYFLFLERSIEKGTQWVVFENNGPVLWANVRRTIEDFLFNEWKSNHLFGTTPEEAYFVKCDRSTMTQNDIDNGRLVCLIGVSPLRPAEFVIFRIGQKTADAQA